MKKNKCINSRYKQNSVSAGEIKLLEEIRKSSVYVTDLYDFVVPFYNFVTCNIHIYMCTSMPKSPENLFLISKTTKLALNLNIYAQMIVYESSLWSYKINNNFSDVK